VTAGGGNAAGRFVLAALTRPPKPAASPYLIEILIRHQHDAAAVEGVERRAMADGDDGGFLRRSCSKRYSATSAASSSEAVA